MHGKGKIDMGALSLIAFVCVCFLGLLWYIHAALFIGGLGVVISAIAYIFHVRDMDDH